MSRSQPSLPTKIQPPKSTPVRAPNSDPQKFSSQPLDNFTVPFVFLCDQNNQNFVRVLETEMLGSSLQLDRSHCSVKARRGYQTHHRTPAPTLVSRTKPSASPNRTASPPPTPSNNFDRFLESTTPSVPAQFLSKVSPFSLSRTLFGLILLFFEIN